jgi:hypothetical protein
MLIGLLEKKKICHPTDLYSLEYKISYGRLNRDNKRERESIQVGLRFGYTTSEQPYREKKKAQGCGVAAVLTVTGLVSYVVTPSESCLQFRESRQVSHSNSEGEYVCKGVTCVAYYYL